ncbi:hypothetical protein PR048_028181 [Dryococelus australis]|uniref:Uncharacterized protein n=1 Tax=Dryococelus australis TaxID=614101 RepID=A0ABQ9GIK0_9NEOP|nr:hypothetical protein PR048_028181 [Dryococelus australis]
MYNFHYKAMKPKYANKIELLSRYRFAKCNDKIMKESVGLRAKIYANRADDKENKKSKGVKKCIVNKLITFDDYKNCLFKDKIHYRTMNLIRSEKHKIYSVEVNKTALSPYDDKRIILENKINTVPHGYRNREYFDSKYIGTNKNRANFRQSCIWECIIKSHSQNSTFENLQVSSFETVRVNCGRFPKIMPLDTTYPNVSNDSGLPYKLSSRHTSGLDLRSQSIPGHVFKTRDTCGARPAPALEQQAGSGGEQGTAGVLGKPVTLAQQAGSGGEQGTAGVLGKPVTLAQQAGSGGEQGTAGVLGKPVTLAQQAGSGGEQGTAGVLGKPVTLAQQAGPGGEQGTAGVLGKPVTLAQQAGPGGEQGTAGVLGKPVTLAQQAGSGGEQGTAGVLGKPVSFCESACCSCSAPPLAITPLSLRGKRDEVYGRRRWWDECSEITPTEEYARSRWKFSREQRAVIFFFIVRHSPRVTIDPKTMFPLNHTPLPTKQRIRFGASRAPDANSARGQDADTICIGNWIPNHQDAKTAGCRSQAIVVSPVNAPEHPRTYGACERAPSSIQPRAISELSLFCALSDELRRPECVLSDVIMTKSREREHERALSGFRWWDSWRTNQNLRLNDTRSIQIRNVMVQRALGVGIKLHIQQPRPTCVRTEPKIANTENLACRERHPASPRGGNVLNLGLSDWLQLCGKEDRGGGGVTPLRVRAHRGVYHRRHRTDPPDLPARQQAAMSLSLPELDDWELQRWFVSLLGQGQLVRLPYTVAILATFSPADLPWRSRTHVRDMRTENPPVRNRGANSRPSNHQSATPPPPRPKAMRAELQLRYLNISVTASYRGRYVNGRILSSDDLHEVHSHHHVSRRSRLHEAQFIVRTDNGPRCLRRHHKLVTSVWSAPMPFCWDIYRRPRLLPTE